MNVKCVYFRNWAAPQTDWCICNWKTCIPQGCSDFDHIIEKTPRAIPGGDLPEAPDPMDRIPEVEL